VKTTLGKQKQNWESESKIGKAKANLEKQKQNWESESKIRKVKVKLGNCESKM
jgi:hypothetical protein